MKWVLRKTGPPAFLVKDADELGKATAGKQVYLLGYFDKLQVGPGCTDKPSQAKQQPSGCTEGLLGS